MDNIYASDLIEPFVMERVEDRNNVKVDEIVGVLNRNPRLKEAALRDYNDGLTGRMHDSFLVALSTL